MPSKVNLLCKYGTSKLQNLVTILNEILPAFRPENARILSNNKTVWCSDHLSLYRTKENLNFHNICSCSAFKKKLSSHFQQAFLADFLAPPWLWFPLFAYSFIFLWVLFVPRKAQLRARICKRLRSPGIDSKEMIPPAYRMLPGGLVRQPYL